MRNLLPKHLKTQHWCKYPDTSSKLDSLRVYREIWWLRDETEQHLEKSPHGVQTPLAAAAVCVASDEQQL